MGPVVGSMVSANHWLSSIKINMLSWYLMLVSANQASSNSALVDNVIELVNVPYSVHSGVTRLLVVAITQVAFKCNQM